MKKIFLLAITILLFTKCFSQQESRATILGYWKDRKVPPIEKNTKTWDSFWNMADDGQPRSGQVVVTSKKGVATVFYSSADTDSARWQSIVSGTLAMGEGDNIDIYGGDYLANSTVSILASSTYTFHEARIYSNTNTLNIFSAVSVDKWTMNGSAIIEGSYNFTGTPTESGLFVNTCYNFKVQGITFKRFAYRGAYLLGSSDVLHRGFQMSDCIFDSCGTGLYIGARAEYGVFSNTLFNSNTTAIKLIGGNSHFVNAQITYCVNGIHLSTGVNDSHGSFTGGACNHNTGSSLIADSITSGFQFNGMDFHGNGATSSYIDINHCGNIAFNGGQINTPIRASGTITNVEFNNCIFPGSFNAITATLVQRNQLKFKGCHTATASYANNDDFLLLNRNVGIGTSPGYKLHVYDTAGTAISVDAPVLKQVDVRFQKAGVNKWIQYIGASSNDLTFYGNGADRITFAANGTLGIGTLTPLHYLQIKAGTSTVAPLKLTSGTNLSTPITGCLEYNGTNLFFTRSGTTRESVLSANAVNSVSPTAPNRTITVVVDGTTYYLSAKTTND